MNPSQRESSRQKDANSRRILDEAARRRRARKALEALEQDNFHDDPHANLGTYSRIFMIKSCYIIHIKLCYILYLSSAEQKDTQVWGVSGW